MPILRSFNLKLWAPKLVIVEVQELQARYAGNARVQKDAAELQAKFAAAGYSIVYKDVVNTIYKHASVQCKGGD
jgi:predicted nucleic acid-binding protein